jgi:hypothetical protein
MNHHRIPDCYDIYRAVLYPVAFNKKNNITEKRLFHLTTIDENIISSVVSERYAPNSNCIHEYGRRLAEKRQNKSIYCGYYQILVKDIKSFINKCDYKESIKFVGVIHNIEDNEIAHADLTFKTSENVHDIEELKTFIVVELYYIIRGPFKYIEPNTNNTSTTGNPCEKLEYKGDISSCNRYGLKAIWLSVIGLFHKKIHTNLH